MGSNHFLCNSLKISSISVFCWILCLRPCWQPGWGCWYLQPPPRRGSHTSPSPSSGPKNSPTLPGTPSRTQRPPQCRRLAPKPQPSPRCQTAGPAGLQTNKF